MKEVCLSPKSQRSPLIMNILKLRDCLVRDYARYTRSFMKSAEVRIRDKVQVSFYTGAFWPDPLLQRLSHDRLGNTQADELKKFL